MITVQNLYFCTSFQKVPIQKNKFPGIFLFSRDFETFLEISCPERSEGQEISKNVEKSREKRKITGNLFSCISAFSKQKYIRNFVSMDWSYYYCVIMCLLELLLCTYIYSTLETIRIERSTDAHKCRDYKVGGTIKTLYSPANFIVPPTL